jgi:hypothetical protein
MAENAAFCRNLILGMHGFGFRLRRLLRIRTGGGSLEIAFREQVLVRSQSVVARVVAGETLIVPVRAKVGDLASIYSFNGTGTLIWKLLASPKTISQVAAAVAEEYDVEPAQAERDVTDFVSEMKGVGLVEVPVSLSSAMAAD